MRAWFAVVGPSGHGFCECWQWVVESEGIQRPQSPSGIIAERKTTLLNRRVGRLCGDEHIGRNRRSYSPIEVQFLVLLSPLVILVIALPQFRRVILRGLHSFSLLFHNLSWFTLFRIPAVSLFLAQESSDLSERESMPTRLALEMGVTAVWDPVPPKYVRNFRLAQDWTAVLLQSRMGAQQGNCCAKGSVVPMNSTPGSVWH